MKKLLLVLAIAGFAIACNNEGETIDSAAATADSIRIADSTRVADSIAAAQSAVIDTTNKMQ